MLVFMRSWDTREHLKHTRGSTNVHGNENKVAQRAEMFKSMESWIESTVLPLLKPIEKSWQSHDFLPDPLLEDGEFFERVKELREMARELPDEYLVILVGAMITEEALPSYQMGINNLDAINNVTCCSPNPWARWLRGWSAEENRHDEKRHEAGYIKIVEKLFEVDPDCTILAFANMMKKKISMPGRLMYDGPSQKSKHSRRRRSGSSSKEPKDSSGISKASRRKDVSSPRAAKSSSKGLPNIPKQSRRKKSKDGEGSERSSGRRKDQALSTDSKHGPIHGSEDGSAQSYTSDQTCQSSGLATLHEGEVKG
ncbi:hypothetical protein Nepgr_004420 [Nepenthes gracilis]|uniref:Uncharacterized protein n=1 Tax=Nepenthes gracilis TaxID=150966 RepID=A0AAD3XFB5_NEPGR|nr:hypothetical protein Nepgr_004420 [Nepenthes gracilis]